MNCVPKFEAQARSAGIVDTSVSSLPLLLLSSKPHHKHPLTSRWVALMVSPFPPRQMPVSAAHGWDNPAEPYPAERVHRADGPAGVAPHQQGGYAGKAVQLTGVHVWRMFSGGGGLCGVAGEDETFIDDDMVRFGCDPILPQVRPSSIQPPTKPPH